MSHHAGRGGAARAPASWQAAAGLALAGLLAGGPQARAAASTTASMAASTTASAVASPAASVAAPATATVAAAAAAATPKPAARARAESIRFVFGWPAGQDLQVRAEKSLARNAGPRVTQITEYRLYLKQTDAGLQVTPGNFEMLFPGRTPGAPPRRDPMPFMQARAAATVFLVAPTGRFARLGDVTAARLAMAKSAQDLLERLGLMDSFDDDAEDVAADTAPDVVEQVARGYWDPAVGQWAGAEFVLDREYEYDDTVPLPTFGNLRVPAKRKVYVHRAPDCERDGVRRRCVYLEVSVQTAPGALEAAVNGVVGGARITAGAGGPIADASMYSTSTLLVEPDGLVPHEYEYENAVRYTSTDEHSPGEVSNIEQDRREFRLVKR